MRGRMAMAGLVMLAGCVAPGRSPAPPPRPAPAPPPPAPAPQVDWPDLPLTPGGWTYVPGAAASAARFGPAGAAPLFVARCDRAARRVTMMRPAGAPAPGAPVTMAITTSAGDRSFPAGSIAGAPGMIGVILTAADPFLDNMAFSRGRFVVTASGTARLVIPAWPEFARVVEDCRG